MDRREARLGNVIRERRIALGLTQEQLAELISDDDEYVRQSEISRIEAGKVLLPRRTRLERLADALGFSFVELLMISSWADDEDEGAADERERDLSDAHEMTLTGPCVAPSTSGNGGVRSANEPFVPSARALKYKAIAERYEENRRRFEQNVRRFEATRAYFEHVRAEDESSQSS